MIGDYVLFGFAQTVVSTIGYIAGFPGQSTHLHISQSSRLHQVPTTCMSPFDQTPRDTRYYKE